jgi:hypothetical protein
MQTLQGSPRPCGLTTARTLDCQIQPKTVAEARTTSPSVNSAMTRTSSGYLLFLNEWQLKELDWDHHLALIGKPGGIDCVVDIR